MDIKEIKERVCEIAEKYNSDYPDIKKIDIWEKLYAIEMALKGTEQANVWCHRVIRKLQKEFSISDHCLEKVFKETDEFK